jgi:ribosome-interacting GTPase 1
MPANLTQQYKKAEEEYRRASSPEEELACLQKMLQEIPKHKGTDHLQAELKSKISNVKKDMAAEKSSGKKTKGLRIPRAGAGTAILICGPNAGKSQLLASLTNAQPEVAPYPFTTTVPAPAMMPWEDVTVQLIDTPPITADYIDPNLYGLIRSSDLVLLLVDLENDDGVEQCQAVLERLSQSKTRLAPESYLDEADVGLSYTKTFIVPNKIDAPDAEQRLALLHELIPLKFTEFIISADLGTNVETLRNAIYESLDVVRVYSKLPTAKEHDRDRPFTIKRGGTLQEMAGLVHKDFVEKLKFARVWGKAVHDGTQVKGDYVLSDKDVVELHK